MAKFLINQGVPMGERVVEAHNYAEDGQLVNFYDEAGEVVFTMGLQYFMTAERLPD